MALARCHLVITDDAGNVVDGATVAVVDEATGALPALYSNRAGSNALGNSFVAADGADAGFHVAGGVYSITATKGSFTRTWRYVGVGTAQETDAPSVTTSISLWIPARSLIARTTNGPSAGSVEMATNKNMFVTKDFDASTAEYAQFDVVLPAGYDGGAIRFHCIWSHAVTATNFGVNFALAGVAIADAGAGDLAFGTAVAVNDTGGTTNATYISSLSSTLTVAGAPIAGGLVTFQLNRDPSATGDTLAVDARLHGVMLHIDRILPDPPTFDFSIFSNSQYLGAL